MVRLVGHANMEGGGITIGGGEPMMQSRFTEELLEAAGAAYLHTALETCGHGPWEQFEGVLRHVDLLQLDLKHLDADRHRALTGQSNDRILDNLKRVLNVKSPADVIIRVPVIPGSNDSEENIRDTAELVAGLGYTQLELVPYHRLGLSKYAQYGQDCPLDDTELGEPDLAGLRSIVEKFGVRDPADPSHSMSPLSHFS